VLRETKGASQAEKILRVIRPPEDSEVRAKYFALSALVAEDRGNPAEAVRLYGEAFELAPQSFEIYASLVRASLSVSAPQVLPAFPANLTAEQHFALGLLLASRGAFEAAVPHFEETLRMEPASYSATYNLALAYKGAGKTQAAMDLVGHALERKPAAELYNLMASLEEGVGLYVDAVGHYRLAVDLEPTNEQYYFDLGVEYLVHFTFGPALEVFGVGVQKFPRSSREYVGLGFAHYAQREYLEAGESFVTALELDPSSTTAFKAWKALPDFLAPAEWERFVPRLRRLAELHPESAFAALCYGDLLLRKELASGKPTDFDLAQSLFDRAIRLKPDFVEAHLELGNLYATRKQDEKALVEFQAAVRLDPQSDMAHYRLGQTYRNLNQLGLAQQELGRYSGLAQSRREQMGRSRSAIRQFVLGQSGSSRTVGEDKTLSTNPH
jgi:tetratricopeptide (TPR) repeat protein